MIDLFLISVILTPLVFLLIFWFVYNSRKTRSSVKNIGVVVNYSKPENPKMWSGSSNSRNYDDSGKIDIDHNGLFFRGQKASLEIAKDSIEEIKSTQTQSPWKFVIILNIILILLGGYFFTIGSLLLFPIILCLIVLDGMVLVMGTGTEWIEVSYKKEGKTNILYLGQDAGRLFPQYKGVFGGNYDLYKVMTHILKS